MNLLTYTPASYRFIFQISMLGSFCDQHVWNNGKIRPQLFDQFGVGGNTTSLMDSVGVAGVDNLDFEFTAHHEFLGRIDIGAGVGLIDEMAVFLVGAPFDNDTAGHNGLNQLPARRDKCEIREIRP